MLTWLLAPILAALNDIDRKLTTINRKADIIMTQVQVAQEDLDQLDSDIDAATTAIADKIDALAAAAEQAGTPLPEADLSALRENVETLRGLGAPTSEPLPEPPTEEPPAE